MHEIKDNMLNYNNGTKDNMLDQNNGSEDMLGTNKDKQSFITVKRVSADIPFRRTDAFKSPAYTTYSRVRVFGERDKSEEKGEMV